MKRSVLFLVFLIATVFAFAESLDTVWIIRENTGNRSSMVHLENPDLSPGMTMEVYLEQKGLSVKWGEGYVTYTYTYYSQTGEKIWTSEKFSEKSPYSGSTWTLSKVHRVTLPGNIPAGAYRLGFDVTDYHTGKVYTGNDHFTVGLGGSAPAPVQRQESSASQTGTYVCRIGDVEFTLLSVEKDSNRLTLVFEGVNRGDSEEEIRIYNQTTRIVSRAGEEFTYYDFGGRSNLYSGINFAPGVPMKAEMYFKNPATKVDFIALLEVLFYYQDDKIQFRDIPVPWHSR